MYRLLCIIEFVFYSAEPLCCKGEELRKDNVGETYVVYRKSNIRVDWTMFHRVFPVKNNWNTLYRLVHGI